MNFLIYKTFVMFIRLIDFIILIRVLLSWLPIGGDNVIVRFVYGVSEPFLQPIRNLLEKSPLGSGMMLDFSPVILLLLLQMIQTILYNVLF